MRFFIGSILIAVCLLTGVVVAEGFIDPRSDTARGQLKTLRDAVELYRAKTGAFPNKLSDLSKGWERPFLYDVPRDPWNREYFFIRPHCLLSRGGDGELGTS